MMFLVTADNREVIIGVSPSIEGARQAGWEWLQDKYTDDEWETILDKMGYGSNEDLYHDMMLGAEWDGFAMEIKEISILN